MMRSIAGAATRPARRTTGLQGKVEVVMDATNKIEAGADAGHGISFRDAFRVWLRVALLSFGGPAGQIAVMHRILVEEKKWVSESRFLHALNYCMLLPGPEAQQLATYVGWLMHRTAGGIMAGGLFIVPGIIAIMGLSYIYAAYGKVWYVEALFFGLKAAVLAIVVEALVRVGKRALRNNIMIALAGIAFVGIFFFAVPFPIIIIAAGLIGYFGARSGRSEFAGAGHGNAKGVDIDSALGDEVPEHARPDTARALARRPVLGGAVVRSHRCDPDDAGCGQHLWPDRAVLHQDGDGDLRRRLCRARLCRAAGGRALSLAQGAGDARRARHGRDHAGPADHGAAVRGLHGGLSRSRHAAADAGGNARRPACDLGDVHAVLPLDLHRRALYRAAARQQGTCAARSARSPRLSSA